MKEILSGLLGLMVFLNPYWFDLVRAENQNMRVLLVEKAAFASVRHVAETNVSEAYGNNSDKSVQTKLMQDGGECYIIPVSFREFLIPSHCLQKQSKEVYLSGYGYQTIAFVGDINSRPEIREETILKVTLESPVFGTELTIRGFKRPLKTLSVSFGRDGESCKIRYINWRLNFLTYDCPSAPGDSGRILYQNGRPVGIHIGRFTNDGLAVASIRDGLDPNFLRVYGENFDPELKIRCCKKAKKAIKRIVKTVENAGQAVVDTGGKLLNDAGKALEDGFKVVVKKTTSEIENLKKDIQTLPKVFSASYVESKIGEIKLPVLPSLSLSLPQVKFDWPKIDLNIGQLGNLTLANILPKGLNTGTVCVTVEWCALVIVIVVVCVVVGGCQGFGSGGSSSDSGDDEKSDICGDISTTGERRRCIEKLKSALVDLRGRKMQALTKIDNWLDQQTKLLGTEAE